MSYIDKQLDEFEANFTDVEFLHRVPVQLPSNYKQRLKAFLKSSLEESRNSLLDEIEKWVEDNGIFDITVDELKSKLLELRK